MRAAAVALVLIVGAAVVLWYGNTLNSWVLGGLIGGLAALLISIPISLLLFSYLARCHDERAEAEQEELPSTAWKSYHSPEAPVEVYEAHAYALPSPREVGERWDDEPVEYRVPRGRNLPAPSPQYSQPSLTNPRLPAARQGLPGGTRAAESQRYQQPGALPPARVKSQAVAVQRPHPRTGQSMRYPGFPGYRADAQHSAYRSAALRVARHEATRQQGVGDGQASSPPTSKRLPAIRPEQRSPAQQPRWPRPASSSQPLQGQTPQQYRPRRTIEGSPARAAHDRSLPGAGEASTGQLLAPQGRYLQAREAQTDKIGELSSFAAPVRQQTTDQLARNPQLAARRRNPDVISGSLKNPLVRRAPYMYEDDPLRREMSQQIESPLVRRSSRYLDYAEDED